MAGGSKKSPVNRPNFYGMIQQITIRAIDKGQLPFLLIGLIIFFIICRMPVEDTVLLLEGLIKVSFTFYMLGWTLFAFTLLSSGLMVSYLLRSHQREIERISAEKAEWQKEVIKYQLTSKDQLWQQ